LGRCRAHVKRPATDLSIAHLGEKDDPSTTPRVATERLPAWSAARLAGRSAARFGRRAVGSYTECMSSGIDP